jgi:hypothetical protein
MSTDNKRTADKRFAANLFSGTPNHAAADEDQGASEYSDDERQFARNLFVDDEDAPVLLGLKAGRTPGRTTPPRPDDVPNSEFRFS